MAVEVAHAKRAANATQFHDPERERRVLDRLQAKGAGRFPRDAIRVVFREVMSACLALEEPMKVAFPGTEGAFAEVAARHLFGLAARYRETGTIEGVFDAVRAGEAACGVVPVESSTDGSVTLTANTLIESDLQIRQELVLDVAYCLFSKAEGLSGVTRVHGHSHALSQCRLWLAKHLPGAQIIQTVSAAAAAHEAVSDPAAAASANRGAGELSGLPLLRERIHDRPERDPLHRHRPGRRAAHRRGQDIGRLLRAGRARRAPTGARHLRRRDHQPDPDRVSSEPAKALGLRLSRRPGGAPSDPRVAEAIERLRARCEMVKVLGSYLGRPERAEAPRAAVPTPTSLLCSSRLRCSGRPGRGMVPRRER